VTRFDLVVDYSPEAMQGNKARMDAFERREYTDRVPVSFCAAPRFFTHAFGLTYGDFFKDADTQFHYQLQFAKYRIENIPEDAFCTEPVLYVYPYFDNVMDADALGAETVWSETETLRCRPTIGSVEDMEDWDIPPPTSGLWGRTLRWCDRMRELASDTRVRFGNVEGRVEVSPPILSGLSPHMLAIDLVGQDFYWWQLEYPEACHRFLDKITRALIGTLRYFDQVWPRDRKELWIAEDAAQVMSLESFREFCVPYTAQLFDTFLPDRGDRILHMCGKSDHLFPAMVHDLGVTYFSLFGYPVDLPAVARELGGKMKLWGNINPLLMLNGTREDVVAAATRCIDTLGPCGGLLLGDGANVCPGTPLENLAALTEASELRGTDWL